jgi:hypothetical protein
MRATAMRLPLLFIENRGQMENEAAFYTQGRDVIATFFSRGVTLSYTEPSKSDSAPLNGIEPPVIGVRLDRPKQKPVRRLQLDFVDAQPMTEPVGRVLQRTRVSNFTGSQDQWRTDLRTYGEIFYENLWPGINLVYSGKNGRLKYQFEVTPGADPRQIRLTYRNAGNVRMSAEGALEVVTSGGVFRDEKPVAWQEAGAKRTPVFSAYALGSSKDFGFEVGSYDRSQTLIIDPEVFAYATYIGSSGDDRGLGLAVDAAGSVYVTGRIQNAASNSLDIYIGKVNPSGTGFDYFTLIGGTGDDEGFDIVVDSSGNAYATGYTDSPETSFPVVGGPDVTYNGGGDAFVLKLNSLGNTLLYSGYLGGSNLDFGEGIAVDSSGNAYVTGFTGSDQTTFPAVVGPDTTFNGGYDCFVAKVKAAPNNPITINNFLFSGYIGGSGDDVGIIRGYATAGQIALDASGNAYISGMTTSREDTFPTGNGFGNIPGFDHTQNGGYDAFVVKVRADGTGLVYATYIGGRQADYGFGMAVDSAGNAYFSGYSYSNQRSLPVKVGPDLTFNGKSDAIVGKLDPSGTSLVFLGYIGGSDAEAGHGLDIDAAGNVYVIGYTESADFPVVGGPDLTFNGSGFNVGDAFVVKVKANPNAPVVTDNFYFATFIGGTRNDWAFWGRADTLGNFYVIGDTQSD